MLLVYMVPDDFNLGTCDHQVACQPHVLLESTRYLNRNIQAVLSRVSSSGWSQGSGEDLRCYTERLG